MYKKVFSFILDGGSSYCFFSTAWHLRKRSQKYVVLLINDFEDVVVDVVVVVDADVDVVVAGVLCLNLSWSGVELPSKNVPKMEANFPYRRWMVMQCSTISNRLSDSADNRYVSCCCKGGIWLKQWFSTYDKQVTCKWQVRMKILVVLRQYNRKLLLSEGVPKVTPALK